MNLKLNLGCGPDIREGYINVDKITLRNNVKRVDLSILPWPWEDDSANEILMLDFLEHFPYRQTDSILCECLRILRVGGFVDIQVPDFAHCALAAMDMHHYLCNVCGASGKNTTIENSKKVCAVCKTSQVDIAEAAIKRLYGGQDFEGNWHFTAFTKELLSTRLKKIGFKNIKFLEKHHMWKNWNFKVRAFKQEDVWDE